MRARTLLIVISFSLSPVFVSAQPGTQTRELSSSSVRDLAVQALRPVMPDGLELQRATWNQVVRVPRGHVEAVGFLEGEEPVNGRLRARVELLVDGESVRTLRIQLFVRDRRPVVVATRRLRSGDVIGEGDVELRELPPGVYVRHPLRTQSDAVGNMATSVINPGEVIEGSSIRTPPLITRRERVRIIARTGGVEVVAPGEPLQDGALGEVINVVCLVSRRTIEARVIGPGVVEVR